MSIVGNRPLPIYEAELLTSERIHTTLHGSCRPYRLWQVEKRGNSGSMSAEERKQLDIKYAHTFSFWLDAKIISRHSRVRAERGRIIQEFYEKEYLSCFLLY